MVFGGLFQAPFFLPKIYHDAISNKGLLSKFSLLNSYFFGAKKKLESVYGFEPFY